MGEGAVALRELLPGGHGERHWLAANHVNYDYNEMALLLLFMMMMIWLSQLSHMSAAYTSVCSPSTLLAVPSPSPSLGRQLHLNLTESLQAAAGEGDWECTRASAFQFMARNQLSFVCNCNTPFPTPPPPYANSASRRQQVWRSPWRDVCVVCSLNCNWSTAAPAAAHLGSHATEVPPQL